MHPGSSGMNDILKEDPTGFAKALDVNLRERNGSGITPKYLASENIATERKQLALTEMGKTRKIRTEG